MAGTVRNSYTEEFKQHAVSFYIENELPMRAAAKVLGIHSSMLSKWLQRYKESAQDDASCLKSVQELEEKIKVLQRENRELRHIIQKCSFSLFDEEFLII